MKKLETNTPAADFWEDAAKRIIKSELARRGIRHEQLSRLLADMGVDVSKSAIDSRLSRGTFSAAFMLQCLKAIGCENLRVSAEWNERDHERY